MLNIHIRISVIFSYLLLKIRLEISYKLSKRLGLLEISCLNFGKYKKISLICNLLSRSILCRTNYVCSMGAVYCSMTSALYHFSFKHLGLSAAEEVKCRNKHMELMLLRKLNAETNM